MKNSSAQDLKENWLNEDGHDGKKHDEKEAESTKETENKGASKFTFNVEVVSYEKEEKNEKKSKISRRK